MKTDLWHMIGKNEEVLWNGKPNKNCFILECVFNPFLFFALFWGAIDLLFFGVFFILTPSEDNIIPAVFPIAVFFIIHMMPVWIYLGGAVLSFRKYRNTEYITTNKGVYASGEIFTYDYKMKPFAELSHVNIHRGFIDQILNVGDVTFTSPSGEPLTICDVIDYRHIYKISKNLQESVYSDTMLPNDLRPKENHGYQTKYINNEQ